MPWESAVTREFPIGTRFAIYKLNSLRFLLSAQPAFFSFTYYVPQQEYERFRHNNIGLFFLEHNKLQRVSDSDDSTDINTRETEQAHKLEKLEDEIKALKFRVGAIQNARD